MSAGRWENKGRGRWEFTGHGWGVFSVQKGGKKWHAFSEPFGSAPQLLGEFDARPDAQKSVEELVSSLKARKKNPKRRAKSAGALKRELARLADRLANTPTTTDASPIIRRIGDLNVAIADAQRKPARKKTARKKKARAARVARYSKWARKNPKPRNPLSGFQVAALRGDKVMFLSGIGLSTNREAASNFGKVTSARRVARQVRNVAGKFGINRVAVVTRYDRPDEIRRFLLGEA